MPALLAAYPEEMGVSVSAVFLKLKCVFMRFQPNSKMVVISSCTRFRYVPSSDIVSSTSMTLVMSQEKAKVW